jgi:hypothetical protein
MIQKRVRDKELGEFSSTFRDGWVQEENVGIVKKTGDIWN